MWFQQVRNLMLVKKSKADQEAEPNRDFSEDRSLDWVKLTKAMECRAVCQDGLIVGLI